METIFDHNPTKEELRYIGRDWDKDYYLEMTSKDGRNRDLALLMHLRGDDMATEKFASRIKSESMQRDFWRTIYHP